VTRGLGDGWLTKASAALLTVPSAIIPETFNVLLNPAHQDTKRIEWKESDDDLRHPWPRRSFLWHQHSSGAISRCPLCRATGCD
jgi:hypothetical protein